jgi:hypothetical protein
MGNPTSSGNASPAGPYGRISGRRRPRPAPGRARSGPGARGSPRVPAGPLRRRLQRPPDRQRAQGQRLAGAGGPVPTGGAAGQHRQRLAAQRRRYTQERIAARVAALGFTDMGAYSSTESWNRRGCWRRWPAELGAHRVTVRRLLDRHGIRRCGARPKGGRRPTRDVGCSRWGGRRGWPSWALRIWPRTAGAPCRAGLVGEADAGAASGRAAVAGGGAGPAGFAIPT